MRTTSLRWILLILYSALYAFGQNTWSVGTKNYSMIALARRPGPPVPPLKAAPFSEVDGACLLMDNWWPKNDPSFSKVQGYIHPIQLVGYGENQFDWTGYANYSIEFWVDRVVSDDVDKNGFLNHPQQLIADGIIAPTVKVKFAISTFCYREDGLTDSYANNDFKIGVRLISVNGKLFGQRGGPGATPIYDSMIQIESFYILSYDIPVEMVKFPVRAGLGVKLNPAVNYLELSDNLVGSSEPYMCWPARHVAWSLSKVKAMAPIMLVHGTNADHTTWTVPKGDSFVDYFGDSSYFSGICFTDIDLTANGSIDDNGRLLESKVAERLAAVGAKACHLVAHSKGGIDSRSMIRQHYYDKHANENLDQPGHFEVLSLYTLDTPHRGTVLSDISWNKLHNPNPVPDPQWPDLVNLMNWDFPSLHDPSSGNPDGKAKAPTGHALEAQRTERMRMYNGNNPFNFSTANTEGRPIKFYNTAADADWHVRDLTIDGMEIKDSPYVIEKLGSSFNLNALATSAYRMLYWAKQVQPRSTTQTKLVYDRNLGGDIVVTIPVTELYVPAANPQADGTWNDLVVSITSALYDGGTVFCPFQSNSYQGTILGNHSSIKTHSLAAAICGQIAADWPLK